MKKILITGAAGFIGSNLTKRLLDEGNYVIGLDNFYTGQKENIEPFLTCKNFEFHNHNIINPYDFEVDEIYNLACPASPPHYQKDPIFTFKTSVFGILNALELARKTGAKLLQASTSEVYGDAKVYPQDEKYFGNVNPNGIRACYDEGKRAAETLMCDYRRQFGLDVKIARIFNTYGENMDINDGRVVSNFIVQAIRGENFTIYGDGSQTRSFCYVSDLIEGLTLLMQSDIQGPVNLGNPCEFTIKDFSNLVLNLTNSNSGCVYLPLPSDDPVKRKPDISYAKEALGFEPKVKIDEGIKKTVAYFKKRIEK